MKHKTSNKLFMEKYQHKIVLVCPGVSMFRGGDFALIKVKLAACRLDTNSNMFRGIGFRTQENLDYARKLNDLLYTLDDITVRVESPRISIYTNTAQHLIDISNLDQERVKYTMSPPEGANMEVGTVIMPKVPYEYRITVGATAVCHEPFVAWAEANESKVKLTKGCRKQLLQNRSYGCGNFYITGEKMLLMAKVHLGSSITRIERIIKK